MGGELGHGLDLQPTSIGPFPSFEKGNRGVKSMRTAPIFGAMVQCAATVAMVRPSFDQKVMHRNAPIEHTSAHHFTSHCPILSVSACEGNTTKNLPQI